MIPNKWVIIWNGKPVGSYRHSPGRPMKTEIIEQIHFFDSRDDADKYAGRFMFGERYEIREIQFRIMDHK